MVVAHTVQEYGLFLQPLFQVARMLAACPDVMSLYGVSTPAEAYQLIRWPRAADAPDVHGEVSERPRIILSSNEWGAICQSKATFTFSGQVLIRIERPAYHVADYFSRNQWPENYWPTNYWPERKLSVDDQTADAMVKFGAIIRQFMANNGGNPGPDSVPDPTSSTYAEFKSLNALIEAELVDPADWDGAYFAVGLYAVNWGTGA